MRSLSKKRSEAVDFEDNYKASMTQANLYVFFKYNTY